MTADKSALRRALLSRRAALPGTYRALASLRIVQATIAAQLDAPGVVAGYWPNQAEADIRPLLSYWYAHGRPIALPVVTGPDDALTFRRWIPGDRLESGPGALAPLATAQEIVPLMLLVPLVGFDARGHRLGYGKGYYDRTLAALRGTHQFMAIGVAFDAQECAVIPTEAHDQRLDGIATEAGLRWFADR